MHRPTPRLRGRTEGQSKPPAYKAWYKTKRWQQLRWSILVRDRFTCAMCGKLEGKTSQLVADHEKPHKGDEALFWNEGNLRCVCKTCHDSDKQRIEKGGKAKPTIGTDGWPIT